MIALAETLALDDDGLDLDRLAVSSQVAQANLAGVGGAAL